ncbi:MULTISPECIES: trimeric porin PorB [unclassified Neisseria]|uniref:trimeric porin PorB n=1 Tax=unclassified Neisseria TaxID=2623750 RepID=UPI00266665A9|nr:MULTISPECIES: trimeric porin PorB [unclassified Neisseria]MDO1510378.1 trimeric porin PorB [Neisseria sp. MVDL19-042950]MDO1516547.1 trimeric porin PorB [Neisseria sp. MVDL18-041461]MDO1563660.1 trimeric porin PorB [Neisseria sp. MVDL20-010259]
MKKTLIALTLATLPVAAFADVTLYGQIKAGVEVSKIKTGSGVNKDKSKTATEIADFGSRIGFKGHEHIGSGLNAIWQIENKVSVAGGGELAGRESFIGLEGGFGKIRAGKLATQLDDMDQVDPWEYNSSALGLGVFTRTGKKVTSIKYDTPVFGGFSANVQYTPRDNANPADKYDHKQPAKDAYYAGLNYENSGFFAQYGVGVQKNAYNLIDAQGNPGKGKTGHVHRIGGGYDANNLFVAVGAQYDKGFTNLDTYERAFTGEDKPDRPLTSDEAGGLEIKEVAVTGAYRFGNVTPRVSYAHGWDVKELSQSKKPSIKDSKYDQVIVGADYDFSKRTTALVSAGWLRAGKGDTKYQSTAGLVGLRHKF